MDKQLVVLEEHKPVTYEELSLISEKLAKPVDIQIIDMPEMRVLSSCLKDNGNSDVDGFWQWINRNGIPSGIPGRHEMFEYQNSGGQLVIIVKIPDTFINSSPYADYILKGGLYAVGSVYIDEEIGEFHKEMIKSFDGNKYYEVDFLHDGRLRHESLVETVISPDDMREKVDVFIPVKKRIPDASHYDENDLIESISLCEIEKDNPVFLEFNIPLNEITPILDPHYAILESGEAEYISWISARKLSTNVSVEIPFRVDIEFKVEDKSKRFGYGSDEGSIRFYHGNNLFGINMENKADSRLSKEAICFNQPILGNYFSYPKLGRINYNEYNTLTWIVGEKHFAVVINNEVRYCGVNFPYMDSDLHLQKPETIIIGADGQGKKYFRSIKVSKLKTIPKIKIKKGELFIIRK